MKTPTKEQKLIAAAFQHAFAYGLIDINNEQLLKQYAINLKQGRMEIVTEIEDNKSFSEQILVDCIFSDFAIETHLSLQEDIPEKTVTQAIDDIPDHDDDAYFHVVRVERGESKGSLSPMWELQSIEGERLWVFKHKKEERNNYPLFEDAAYGDHFSAMVVGEVIRWQKNPITMRVEKVGKFWQIREVLPRGFQQADSITNFFPQRKADVVNEAKAVVSGFVIDVETTGIDSEAQVVEIGLLNPFTGEVFQAVVKPSVAMNAKAQATHGIDPDEIANAPLFPEIWEQCKDWFSDNDTIILHAPKNFDLRVLNQTFAAYGLPQIEKEAFGKIINTHEMMSRFIGDPYGAGQTFRYQSLSDSLRYLGLPTTSTHRALDDARCTWSIIEALQEIESPTLVDEDYIVQEKHPF